jgi:hypothetical protein
VAVPGARLVQAELVVMAVVGLLLPEQITLAVVEVHQLLILMVIPADQALLSYAWLPLTTQALQQARLLSQLMARLQF